MATELPELGANRVIVELPDLAVGELVPVAEVLCQEGFGVWTLPSSRLDDLAELHRLFGRRARIGLREVADPATASAAAASGAALVMSNFLLPDLVQAAPELPVVLGGLTPSELRSGLEAGAAAVQLVPAEAFGTAYARVLPQVLGSERVIISGRVERYQAEMWLEQGGCAVCPRDLIDPDAILGDSLDGLREVLQRWSRPPS